MPYVRVYIKGVDGYTTEIFKGDRVVVGRSSKCDLTIAHNSVSREHTIFVRNAEGVWSVADAGSSNGTRVNRDKIDGERALCENDIIKIGKARLKFHAADEPPEKAADAGIKLDAAALGSGGDIPVLKVGPDDPTEAMTCHKCGAILSVAHHLPGDPMDCPRCAAKLIVPSVTVADEAADSSQATKLAGAEASG